MYSSQKNDHGNCCYIVQNLDKSTSRDTLWKVFGEFGTIKQIEVQNGAVAIIYTSKPLDQVCTRLIYIKDRLVSVNEMPMVEYLKEAICSIPVSKLLLGGLSTPSDFVAEWSTEEYVTFDINLNERHMEVFFPHVDSYYRFRINYDKTLKDNVVLQRHANTTSLTISGKYPAYFWRSKIPMHLMTDTYHLDNWERVTEIPFDEDSSNIMRNKASTAGGKDSKGPILPGGQYPNHIMKLHNWTVYRLEFDIPAKSPPHLQHEPLSPKNLTHEAVEKKFYQATHFLPSTSIILNHMIQQSRHPQIKVCPHLKTIDVAAMTSHLPFEVQYMIEHAFYLKILREYNVDADFMTKIIKLPPQVSCVFLTLLSAPQQRIYTPETSMYHIYKLTKDHIGNQQHIDEDCALVRKVLITPTSIYPLQPTVEPMNHLQYHFKQYEDRFLLVQFTDEDLGPVAPITMIDEERQKGQPVFQPPNVKIYDRIINVLRRGVKIGGRHFEFLGTSINDLRMHRGWFFSSTAQINRMDILNWMGDFREIKSLAKLSNCVGQSLTPRLLNMAILASEIEEMDDYEDETFTTTNLCGKISPQIAQEIGKRLDLSYTPSVVQFNLNGAHGILMLSNYLKKRKICLRTGQIAFNSNSLTLEVIKVSKPSRLFLNRHVITLLCSLGVKHKVFHDIVNETLSHQEKQIFHRGNVHNDLLRFEYSNGRMADFQHVLDCEFLERGDPFIFNLVTSYQNSILHGFKNQSKIYIPFGIKTFAVMDETGTLTEGEVFLQVTDESGLASERQLIQGRCMVYRDTCCLPTDVKTLTAVNEPKLRQYTNVLVYSSKGMNELPKSISSDDDDDDNYNIIWDHRLLPPRENPLPRNYQAPTELNNLKKVSFKELSKFLAVYISRDVSHDLKKAYIAIADRHREGAFNGDCMYIAQQISLTVDYARTGIPAAFPPEFKEYPFPDFMEENELKTYTTPKVLGTLYRSLYTLEEKPLSTEYCCYDPRMYVEDMYKYVVDARKNKARYDHSLRILLGQYSVQTEIEFISGHIISWPKYLTPNQREELVKSTQAAYVRFKKYWRSVFEAEFMDQDCEDPAIVAAIEAKAAAWYYVVYHPSEFKTDDVYNHSMRRFMSFPWTVDSYISYICDKNARGRPVLDEHTARIPPEKIERYMKKNAMLYSDIVEAIDDDEDESEDEADVIIIPLESTSTAHVVPRESASPTVVETVLSEKNGSTYNSNENNNSQQSSSQNDNPSVPVVTIKLSDLLI